MSTELLPGKKIRRQIKVYGVEAPVLVTFSTEGIEFKIKGAKVGTTLTWHRAAQYSVTPDNVPSAFAGEPIKFMNSQASKIALRKLRKEQKKTS